MVSKIFYTLHIIVGILALLSDDAFLAFFIDFYLKMGFGVFWATIATMLSVVFIKEKRRDLLYWVKTWLLMNVSVHWVLIITTLTGASQFFY